MFISVLIEIECKVILSAQLLFLLICYPKSHYDDTKRKTEISHDIFKVYFSITVEILYWFQAYNSDRHLHAV